MHCRTFCQRLAFLIYIESCTVTWCKSTSEQGAECNCQGGPVVGSGLDTSAAPEVSSQRSHQDHPDKVSTMLSWDLQPGLAIRQQIQDPSES